MNDTSEAVTAPETPEAEAAPDVPTAEASEEDHKCFSASYPVQELIQVQVFTS